MSVVRILAPVLLLLASAACGTFGSGGSAVELDAAGAAAGSQWNATLASPAAMAGVVQMTGTVTMAPTADSSQTMVTVNLANASPGGMHPWEVRTGECGSASRSMTFGMSDAYEPLVVGSDGRARSMVTIDAPIPPTTGRYSVVVRASEDNYRTIVACGNLAAPTR